MKKAYVLINIGTPESPQPKDVGVYLKEFLMDPDVISLPFLFRWILVNVLIVPRRKYASAEAYQKVWTERGSPLLTFTEDLCEELNKTAQPDEKFYLAMRYGNPSVDQVLAEVKDFDEIIVVPMFPQYAGATTGSMTKKAQEVSSHLGISKKMKYLEDFFADPFYVDSLTEQIKAIETDFEYDHLLFSYHGLPEKLVQDADSSGSHCLIKKNCCDKMSEVNRYCYRAQCYATTRAVVKVLKPQVPHSVSFQSRLGRTEWIKPYTEDRVKELASQGVKKLAVTCPAFLIDCLETLEEISIGLKETFVEAGGEDLQLIPCLNADPAWSARFQKWMREEAQSKSSVS